MERGKDKKGPRGKKKTVPGRIGGKKKERRVYRGVGGRIEPKLEGGGSKRTPNRQEQGKRTFGAWPQTKKGRINKKKDNTNKGRGKGGEIE